MKKYLFVSLVASVILLGQSFKVEAPVLNPNPVPPGSMVDITDLEIYCYYHNDNQPLYAIKVGFFGYSYNTGEPVQCWDIVEYPATSSVWNADDLYRVDDYTWVTAKVYVKRYSSSSWELWGSMLTKGDTRVTVTTSQPNCLLSMQFSIYDVALEEVPIDD